MNRFRELREEYLLTQSELADKLGISTSSIGMYEQGRRIPSPKILSKMSKILDASIEYMLGNSPVRMRPSGIGTTHSYTIPDGEMEERLLESAMQDEEGKEMLKRMLKEKIAEINFSPIEHSTAKALGKMLSMVKDDESKRIKMDIIKTIAEADFTVEQLRAFHSFLTSFVAK